MSEVAKIKGRVRYAAFKKTIKVMIRPTDSLDDLKAQLNAYFVHIGENQHRLYEYAWKTTSYMPYLSLLKTIATSDLCFVLLNLSICYCVV